MGTEDAIVFTTGHQANVGALGTILGPERHGRSPTPATTPRSSTAACSRAPSCAPSATTGSTSSSSMLERAADDGGGVLVVVDGVFSMEGDVAPLPEIVRPVRALRRAADGRRGARRRRARRARRRARPSCFGVEDRVDLRMGTFSKSLASCGGFIAGPADVIEFLRIQSRAFLFTASAVPAAVGAALAALRIVRSRRGPRAVRHACSPTRAYLQRRPRRARLQGRAPRRPASPPIVPVLVGDDWKAGLLWKALYDAGVFVNTALHPAVPPGGALLRTSVMATHDTRDARPRARRLRLGQGVLRGRARSASGPASPTEPAPSYGPPACPILHKSEWSRKRMLFASLGRTFALTDPRAVA